MERYNFSKIEKKWQNIWEEKKEFKMKDILRIAAAGIFYCIILDFHFIVQLCLSDLDCLHNNINNLKLKIKQNDQKIRQKR